MLIDNFNEILGGVAFVNRASRHETRSGDSHGPYHISEIKNANPLLADLCLQYFRIVHNLRWT